MANIIKFDHVSLDHASYISRIREIIADSTGNADFLAIAAKIIALATGVNTLETKNNAYNLTVQLAATQLTELNNQRAATEELVRSTANGAESETTDKAKLQGGGWHVRGEPTPIGEMPPPQDVRATGGDMEGECDLQWDPVYGRDAYVAEWAESSAGPWTQFYVGNKSSTTCTGLTPGELYWFRVRAVGPLGPGQWSDFAQKRAS